jgi:hypothetical protein
MKNIFLTGLTLVLISFSGLRLNGQNQNNKSFLIKQIMSKNGFHIIYATKDDTLYKIVSKKEKPKVRECNKIVVGEYYNLDLHSNIPIINGVKILPVNYLDVKSMFSPRQSVYSIEPKKGIFDSFHAENIKGLCINQ